MKLPKELSKLKLKQIYCEECVSFDRKTKAYCFLTKGPCKPKQKACKRVKYREEDEE